MSGKWINIGPAIILLVACTANFARAENSAQRCASLAAQWDAAKTAKASSPNLGRAKAWATTAAHDCAKTEASRQEDGANEYIKALKLVGVTPK